jgi:hypothetical protein
MYMKQKLSLWVSIIVITIFSSICMGCGGTIGQIFFGAPVVSSSGSNPHPCDNTTSDFVISLDFSKTSYHPPCEGTGLFASAISKPPLATSFNYLNKVSSTGTGSLLNGLDYMCQMVIRNVQNASSSCTNPGTQTFTWNVPGGSQTIKSYRYANTQYSSRLL